MSDILRYEVIVEGSDAEGYSAFLPSLLGCVTAARTIEEIKTMIAEAVTIHVEGMAEDGLSLPKPLTPEQAEEAFGMPIPDSVLPSLFIEVSDTEPVVSVTTTSLDLKTPTERGSAPKEMNERRNPMPNAQDLRNKFESIWPGQPPAAEWYRKGENSALRIHRAISWVERAEKEMDDLDAKFIFYWIAFDASYGQLFGAGNPNFVQWRREYGNLYKSWELHCIDTYLENIIAHVLPGNQRAIIHESLRGILSNPIKSLVENRFVFHNLWKFYREYNPIDDWETQFAREYLQSTDALNVPGQEKDVLDIVFKRLYVMRSQMFHGSSSWNSPTNRTQITDGVNIVECLIPIFLKTMIEYRDLDWGPLRYPRITLDQLNLAPNDDFPKR